MGSNPVQTVALVAAALFGAFGLYLIFRRSPRAGSALWVALLFFTPVWLNVSAFGLTVTVLTAATLVALVAGHGRGVAWSHIDTLMLVLVVVVALAAVFGQSLSGHVQEMVLMWLVPYAWGRVILGGVTESWLAACICGVAAVAAVLAILEFVTGQNLFLLIPGADSTVWGRQQERAGLNRVEGAFGHSIALGGSLAMTTTFIMVARLPAWLRAGLLVLVGVATALTFSRLGIAGFAMTVVLAVILLGRLIGRSLQAMAVGLLVVGLVAAAPTLLQIFGDAGAEAEGSAAYRTELLPLIDSMALLGISPSHERLATGEDYWGGFRSIDSALILAGLQFGLIFMALLALLLVILVIGVVRWPTPAGIALLGQVPAFFTVALITQYSSFVWFMAGLAVASTVRRAAPAELSDDHFQSQREHALHAS